MRRSGINTNWSRLVVTRDLLCLVALENLLLQADRLQPLPCQNCDLEQRANVKSRSICVAEIGGGRFRHPDRHVEALTGRRDQVVSRRWPPAPLADPQYLTRQGMPRIVDSDVLGIRILLMVGTMRHVAPLGQAAMNKSGQS